MAAGIDRTTYFDYTNPRFRSTDEGEDGDDDDYDVDGPGRALNDTDSDEAEADDEGMEDGSKNAGRSEKTIEMVCSFFLLKFSSYFSEM